MVSRSKHISTSYSCNDPCPPYLVGWLDGLDTPIILNATSNTSAWQTANYDSGYNMGPYSVPADWSVDSSAISDSPSGGHTTTVTGEEPGNGCVSGDMGSQERYAWDGQNCYDENFSEPIGDTACTEVPVNIRRLQYLTGGNHDIEGTIYVLKGTTVTFNALPDPPGATFPSNKPSWSGSSGITGTGQSKAVTFDTTSSSATDFKTVIATAGNVVSANVIVLELSGNLTPDDNFSGRSTTSFGVNEQMTLSVSITPSGLTALQVGGIEWVQSGQGTFGTQTDGVTSYIVSETPESATLKPTMSDGPSKGSGPATNITAVAPSGGTVSKEALSGIEHYQGWWSCGFFGNIYLSPKDVSFGGLFFKELDIGASASGWLTFLNGHGHDPKPGGTVIGLGDIVLGCRVGADDRVFGGKYRSAEHGAYADGEVSWAIPWKYSIDGSTWHDIGTTFTANQTASSNSSGKCFINKAGSATISADLNAADSAP
jgi:hypothetical protein